MKTSERIFSEAAALFRRKGYANATTRDLADSLGIQKASLYHHISAKSDLLYAICLESVKQFLDEVGAEAEAEPAETRLERMIRAHLTLGLRNPDTNFVMLTEARALPPEQHAELMTHRGTYDALITAVLAEEQAVGRIRPDIDSKYLRLALLSLLNWPLFWFNPKGEATAEEIAIVLTEIFLHGAVAPLPVAPGGRQDAAAAA